MAAVAWEEGFALLSGKGIACHLVLHSSHSSECTLELNNGSVQNRAGYFLVLIQYQTSALL